MAYEPDYWIRRACTEKDVNTRWNYRRESWKNWTDVDVNTGSVNISISQVFDDRYYIFSPLSLLSGAEYEVGVERLVIKSMKQQCGNSNPALRQWQASTNTVQYHMFWVQSQVWQQSLQQQWVVFLGQDSLFDGSMFSLMQHLQKHRQKLRFSWRGDSV